MESNQQKMREALSDACYAMFNFLKLKNGGYEEMANALDKAKSALSAPPRNCDIGTAEEQAQRYDQFCKENECSMCPVHAKWRQHFDVCKHKHISCGLIWAQMPYEAEEGAWK